MNNLTDFSIDFLESSLITVDQENISQEDAITRDIIDYITDSGEVLEPEICHYKVRGIKINAFDYDDDNETLDLFITIFKSENRLQKVADKEIKEAFKKALNFFNAAGKGQLSGKVDESEEIVFELVQIIEQNLTSIKNLRIFVLTNGTASADIVPSTKKENGVYITFQLWDIERVFQQYLIKAEKQKIEIDFTKDYGHRLKCLHMDKVNDKVDTYLAIIPGKILADIYNKYRQGLLEKNVRTFLQFKAKVNQGIRDTIRKEPDMFFAYNNGISTTAENVEVKYDNNVPYLTRIENWQIVNGGQTTASIFATYAEKDIDLSSVHVQMKIAVIKHRDKMDDIVAKISRFANSQTAIKDSDFSSNSPYHIAVENYSRSEWVPSQTGGKATNKWFYERTRGQYLDERSKRLTPSEIRKFDIEYPRKQKFCKTDLAKYEMSWLQKPYDVSKGAENNFKIFTKEINIDKSDWEKSYYYRLIAKAILFKEIDKIVMKANLGGYKANMVSYIVSLLSYKSDKKLNLDDIWERQGISEGLHNFISKIIPVIWDHITNPSKTGMNIGEWCKKQDCWFLLKDKYIDISSISDEFVKGDESLTGFDERENNMEAKVIDEVSRIKPEIWFSIHKWAKEKGKFTPFDRKLIYNLGVLVNRKNQISYKQAQNALRILKSASENGFKFPKKK